MESESMNIYKYAREYTKTTQEQWAELIDVSVDSVRRYESGRMIPSEEVVERMCIVSGFSPLAQWHMANSSRLYRDLVPQIKVVPVTQAVCDVCSNIRAFVRLHRDDDLLDMVADGKIDEIERPAFDAIVKELKSGIVRAAFYLEYAEGDRNQ